MVEVTMSTFIETIRRIVSDPSVVSRNPTWDSSLIAMLVDRISALTPDVTSWLTASEPPRSGRTARSALAAASRSASMRVTCKKMDYIKHPQNKANSKSGLAGDHGTELLFVDISVNK
jgi:hypothetical protein